jgi:peptide/nickel transport system permease protein
LTSRIHHQAVQRSRLLSIARRAGGAVVLLWLVVTIVFALVRLAPGDPAAFLVAPTASAEDAARLRAELGLDRSLVAQYGSWAKDVLTGNFGESFATRRPVSAVLLEAAPVSIWLGIVSLALTFLIGVPIGMLQAARRGSGIDRSLTVVTSTVYAIPTFWLALAMVAVFTYGAATLGLPPWMRLPAFGISTPGVELEGFARIADLLRHAAIPVFTLSVVGAAGIARYARSGAADIIPQDYVRTAWAKGASPGRVYGRHVLRALLPQLVVLFALSLPGLVAGSVFVESVFAWPGMGRATLLAIQARDYPVVMGASVFYAAAVIVANLLADLSMPLLDPRRRR